MKALRFDAEQRFTCRQCARCCRRGWDIALTAGEVEAYRRAKAGRFYREREDAPEGTDLDPFEPIPGHPAYQRIRKRADGACGFLSPQNRCRIHEELGGAQKPLTCRLFPFRFHPGEAATVVTASFSCPTVARSDGALVSAQERDLVPLAKAWLREHPETPRGVELVSGVPVSSETAEALRSVLLRILDRPGPSGEPDIASSAARMAALLDDLSRYRVTRLKPHALSEYVALVGPHAAVTMKAVPAKPPSALARLLFRGFLFVVLAGHEQADDRDGAGLRLGLRLRLARLLAHVHGLGPRVGRLDLRAARRVRVDLGDADVRALARNYLRAAIAALGTGRRPMVEDLSLAAAFLNAACALAAVRAAAEGKPEASGTDFAEGLMQAVDLTHADSGGWLGSIVETLSAGVEAMWMLAAGGPFAGAQRAAPAGRAAEE